MLSASQPSYTNMDCSDPSMRTATNMSFKTMSHNDPDRSNNDDTQGSESSCSDSENEKPKENIQE